MRLLGLPGVNAATGPWMDSVLATVTDEGLERQTQYYDFWNKETEPDLTGELERAADYAPSFIIAKSMGTLVTLRGVASGVLAPVDCVLIGIPVNGLREPESAILKSWRQRTIRTLFIQQTEDRTGGFEQLCELVGDSAHLTQAEVPGSDHVYSDVEELGRLINGWLV